MEQGSRGYSSLDNSSPDRGTPSLTHTMMGDQDSVTSTSENLANSDTGLLWLENAKLGLGPIRFYDKCLRKQESKARNRS